LGAGIKEGDLRGAVGDRAELIEPGLCNCAAALAVHVASVRAAGRLPAGSVERGCLFLHHPVSGQGPVVEPQLRRGGVDVSLARYGAAGRCEVLGPVKAGVVLW